MNVFRFLVHFCLTFILIFFICIFSSTFIFTSPWMIVSAFFSEDVKFAILLTLTTATCSTMISSLIGIPAAYFLSRSNFFGKAFIETLMDIPIALPPVSLGVLLLIFLTNTPIGIYINESILRFVFEPQGLILAQFAVISVYTVKLSKSAFDGIPPRYEKISRVLGYNELQTFVKITLPMAKNGILSAVLLSWARAVGEFGAGVTLAGATKFKTTTLPILLYLSLSEANLGKALAIITIILALSVSVILAARMLPYRRFII